MTYNTHIDRADIIDTISPVYAMLVYPLVPNSQMFGKRLELFQFSRVEIKMMSAIVALEARFPLIYRLITRVITGIIALLL